MRLNSPRLNSTAPVCAPRTQIVHKLLCARNMHTLLHVYIDVAYVHMLHTAAFQERLRLWCTEPRTYTKLNVHTQNYTPIILTHAWGRVAMHIPRLSQAIYASNTIKSCCALCVFVPPPYSRALLRRSADVAEVLSPPPLHSKRGTAVLPYTETEMFTHI